MKRYELFVCNVSKLDSKTLCSFSKEEDLELFIKNNEKWIDGKARQFGRRGAYKAVLVKSSNLKFNKTIMID